MGEQTIIRLKMTNKKQLLLAILTSGLTMTLIIILLVLGGVL